MSTVQLITTSRLRVWQACAMKHHLKYEVRLSPVRPDESPRRFGTLIHEGEEAFWVHLRDHGTSLVEQAIALKMALARMDAVANDPMELAKARALMRCYAAHWLHQNARWQVRAVEVEFRIPLINPATGKRSRKFDLGGKIDVIVEIMDGRFAGLYTVEHKTSSEDITPGSNYHKKLRMDDQITIYHDGAKSLGFDVRGCIYDVLLRPQQKPSLTTPEEKRIYTKGKGCPTCGGKVGIKGSGVTATDHEANGGGNVKLVDVCATCDGGGWKDAPRLKKGQRLEDELASEFEERIFNAISANPSRYFYRSEPPVVRLQDAMERMRMNHWNQVQDIVADARKEYHPMSTSSCFDFHSCCDYWDLCVGDSDINDGTRFEVRAKRHPELSQETQTKGSE